MTASQTSRIRCGYCYRPIHQQRNGAWYHDHNASVACKPGAGNGRQAFPGGRAQTPAAEDDTRSQSGRPADTTDGGQDREAGEDNPRQGPGLPGAGNARGAQPPPPQASHWLNWTPEAFDTAAKPQPLTLFAEPDRYGTPDMFADAP